MISYLLDYHARRRVRREEAEIARRFQRQLQQQRRNLTLDDRENDQDEDRGERAKQLPYDMSCQLEESSSVGSYSSLPYTPSCCGRSNLAPPFERTNNNNSQEDEDEDEDAPVYPITVIRNVRYTDVPPHNSSHECDIYFSPHALRHHLASEVDRGRSGVPVVIHAHGGGWQRGDRANEWRGGPNAGRAIARHGMIGVIPSYRLAPASPVAIAIWWTSVSHIFTCIGSIFSSWIWDAFLIRWLQFDAILLTLTFLSIVLFDRAKVRHPEAALDICRVVKWVRQHLAEHVQHADTDRIFLSGHSAGGHLVSLISSDPKYYRQIGLEDTSFIRGVCSISGVYTLIGPIHRDPNSFKNRLFRLTYGAAAFGLSRDNLIDASPITHVSSSAPPFLVMSATSDMGLEVDANMFCQRLKEVGVEYEYHIIHNTSHSTIASRFEKHQAHQHLFQFIDKCCNQKRIELEEEEEEQANHRQNASIHSTSEVCNKDD